MLLDHLREKPSSNVKDSAGPSTWSLTPYKEGNSPPRPNAQPGTSKPSVKEKEEEETKKNKERRRRIAVPTMFGIDQEISLAAHGRMDTQKGGKEKPWRKLRIKPEFNMAEEERKRAFVERVTEALEEVEDQAGVQHGGGGEEEGFC